MQQDIGVEQFSDANCSVGVVAAGALDRGPAREGASGARRATAFLDAPGPRLFLALAEALGLFAASVVADLAYHAVVLQSLSLYRISAVTGLLCALLFSAVMHMVDSTRRLRAPLSLSAVADIAMVWGATVLVVTFFAFSLKATDALSRGATLAYVAFGFAAIVAVRATVPRLLATYCRPAWLSADRAVVVGAAATAGVFDAVAQLRNIGHPAPECVELDTRLAAEDWHAELPSMIGRIYSVARACGHGDICIVAEGFGDEQLTDIVQALQLIPRAVRVIPAPNVERLLHLPRRNVGELYAVELQKAPMDARQRAVKRTLDLALAIPAILFLAPLLGLIAIAIKLTSRGPVLFRQQRLGYRGRPFAILKFRTMTVMEDGASVRQAGRDDIRVTGVGRWLRRSSLDELPQLFNVIRGEMSLIGPRPHAVAHDEFFANLVEHYDVRQYVKPGISGWAQVNGLRGGTEQVSDIRKRVEFDLQYAKNASLWFDFKILLLTFVEIFRARNAY